MKNGDAQWIGGSCAHYSREVEFTKEAQRVQSYPDFNGILFHGFTFKALSADRYVFEQSCYRMYEYLTGVYRSAHYDGKCLGAYICYQEDTVTGTVEPQPFDHSFSMVISACQTGRTHLWPAMIRDAAYYKSFMLKIKEKWVTFLEESECSHA